MNNYAIIHPVEASIGTYIVPCLWLGVDANQKTICKWPVGETIDAITDMVKRKCPAATSWKKPLVEIISYHGNTYCVYLITEFFLLLLFLFLCFIFEKRKKPFVSSEINFQD